MYSSSNSLSLYSPSCPPPLPFPIVTNLQNAFSALARLESPFNLIPHSSYPCVGYLTSFGATNSPEAVPTPNMSPSTPRLPGGAAATGGCAAWGVGPPS